MKLEDLYPIIGFMLTVLIASICFSHCAGRGDSGSFETVQTKVDTVVKRDTITISHPTPADVSILSYRPYRLPLWREPAHDRDTTDRPMVDCPAADSVDIAVAIEQRHYTGADYEAWVSGFDPTLDSLHIYRPSIIITEQQTVTRWHDRRWGISAGIGATLSTDGHLRPGIFVGVSYILYSF